MLTASIATIAAQVETVRQDIAARLAEIPDNPVIRRLSSRPSAFTINVRDLGPGLILSPRYHDTLGQADTLSGMVAKVGALDSVLAEFKHIVATGKSRDGQNLFHPLVRDHLKGML